MKVLLGFIIKEIYHILRDKKTLVVLFGMPIAQLIIFGYAMRNDLNNAKIGILDLSKDNTSVEISQKIMSSGYFVLGSELGRFEDIEPAFKAAKINLAVVFEPNFEKNIQKENSAKVQLIADASDPNSAQTLSRYAESIINDYISGMNKGVKPTILIEPQIKMLYNPELQRRLRLCSRLDSIHSNAHFSPYDFDYNCSRERIRRHGNAFSLAAFAGHNYHWESSPVFSIGVS